MDLEGFVLLRLGGDQGVEAAQARSDAVLFGEQENQTRHSRDYVLVHGADAEAILKHWVRE